MINFENLGERVQILYFNDKNEEFCFRSSKKPTMDQIKELWTPLPDWVVARIDFFCLDDEETDVGKWMLDPTYHSLNRYDMNPLAAEYYAPPSLIGQEWMKQNGVNHTSMSVGDIIVIDGTYYYCANFGWDVLFQDEEE